MISHSIKFKLHNTNKSKTYKYVRDGNLPKRIGCIFFSSSIEKNHKLPQTNYI